MPTVRAIGKPNFSDGVAIRISQHSASKAPPPTHAPAMAAMVGTRMPSMASSKASLLRSSATNSSAVVAVSSAPKSAPAMKAGLLAGAPLNTTALISGRWATDSHRARMACSISAVMAFRAAGRSNNIHSAPSRTSLWTMNVWLLKTDS
ncbi:Uncharacterised protein [Bordetella pertussis]|nr:Uncharacterised protein [Bordetella pertussis]